MADAADIVILNVDDQEAPRYAKTRVLRRADFTVVEAATGYEALRLTEELRPAVVVLDVKLPDLSGIEVCGVIKRKWPGTLVLQTSATFTGGADRVRGLEGGADGYLIQPIDPDELIASVRALLRVREPRTSFVFSTRRSSNACRSAPASSPTPMPAWKRK